MKIKKPPAIHDTPESIWQRPATYHCPTCGLSTGCMHPRPEVAAAPAWQLTPAWQLKGSSDLPREVFRMWWKRLEEDIPGEVIRELLQPTPDEVALAHQSEHLCVGEVRFFGPEHGAHLRGHWRVDDIKWREHGPADVELTKIVGRSSICIGAPWLLEHSSHVDPTIRPSGRGRAAAAKTANARPASPYIGELRIDLRSGLTYRIANILPSDPIIDAPVVVMEGPVGGLGGHSIMTMRLDILDELTQHVDGCNPGFRSACSLPDDNK